MKQGSWTLLEHRPIARDTYLMKFAGDTRAFTLPGQFIKLSLPGYYLRRPFSICDWTDTDITLIYKVLGSGTLAMTAYEPGMVIDGLSGLGRGFDTALGGHAPLLVGGGVGVPPLYRLAKDLIEEGKAVTVALGFNSAAEVFYAREFAELGAQVLVSTVDGSQGHPGYVTQAIDYKKYSGFYACGPTAMLRALCQATDLPGQLSLEERMGCGFGACMGCTVDTSTGLQRVCKEGPVFSREDLAW